MSEPKVLMPCWISFSRFFPLLAVVVAPSCAQIPAQSGLSQASTSGQNASDSSQDYPPPKPAAVFIQTPLPYYALPDGQFLGQFGANNRACITGKMYISTSNGSHWFQYVLPSGLVVYTVTGKGIFSRDPDDEESCDSQVARIDLNQSVEQIYQNTELAAGASQETNNEQGNGSEPAPTPVAQSTPDTSADVPTTPSIVVNSNSVEDAEGSLEECAGFSLELTMSDNQNFSGSVLDQIQRAGNASSSSDPIGPMLQGFPFSATVWKRPIQLWEANHTEGAARRAAQRGINAEDSLAQNNDVSTAAGYLTRCFSIYNAIATYYDW